jgi:hypothetical protein
MRPARFAFDSTIILLEKSDIQAGNYIAQSKPLIARPLNVTLEL